MDTLLLALRVLVSLGVVVGLLWVVQRRSARWSAKRRGTAPITVVARKSLGSKANLVIAEVEGTRFVLGVTEHGVSVLQTAEASAAEPATARVEHSVRTDVTAWAGSAERPAFADLLARASVRAERADSGETRSPLEAAPVSSGVAPAPRPSTLPRPDFRGFAGSITSLETWRQAARSLREPRWPR